jgi:hypothetical protein
LGEASGLSVARAAFMDVAKLNGLVIDRSKSEAVIRTLGQALDELDAEG